MAQIDTNSGSAMPAPGATFCIEMFLTKKKLILGSFYIAQPSQGSNLMSQLSCGQHYIW
jgi:hypothetical protein